MIMTKSNLGIVLDSKHLSSPLFMKLFAQKLKLVNQQYRLILIHGDSGYSSALIQNGASKSEAEIRAIKEINLKLISLLADNGIAAIGVHGYHKNIITLNHSDLQLSNSLSSLVPESVSIILSNLVQNNSTMQIELIPIHRMVEKLIQSNQIEHCLFFADVEQSDRSFKNNDPDPIELLNTLPFEATSIQSPILLTTIKDFGTPDFLTYSVTIEKKGLPF